MKDIKEKKDPEVHVRVLNVAGDIVMDRSLTWELWQECESLVQNAMSKPKPFISVIHEKGPHGAQSINHADWMAMAQQDKNFVLELHVVVHNSIEKVLKLTGKTRAHFTPLIFHHGSQEQSRYVISALEEEWKSASPR